MTTATMTRAEKAAEPVELDLEEILLNPELQQRPELDPGWEEHFEGLFAGGEAVDPVLVYFTPVGKFLVDGWHRYAGAVRAGMPTIWAVVAEGSYRDAVLASCGANSKAALRRTPETIRRSIEAVIRLHDEAQEGLPEADRDRPSTSYIVGVVKCRERDVPPVLEAYYAPRGGVPDQVRGRDGKVVSAASRTPRPAPAMSCQQDLTTVQYGTPAEDEDEPLSDRERGRQEEEERWLTEELVRPGKAPLRDALYAASEASGRRFDKAALAYRRICQKSAAFEQARKEIVAATGARKVSEADDPFSTVMVRSITANHPRDWVLCFDCKGAGYVGGGKCQAFGCKGAGFKLY